MTSKVHSNKESLNSKYVEGAFKVHPSQLRHPMSGKWQRRQQQNREAQRAFRERRHNYVRNLERQLLDAFNQLELATAYIRELEKELSNLREENSDLKSPSFMSGGALLNPNRDPPLLELAFPQPTSPSPIPACGSSTLEDELDRSSSRSAPPCPRSRFFKSSVDVFKRFEDFLFEDH